MNLAVQVQQLSAEIVESLSSLMNPSMATQRTHAAALKKLEACEQVLAITPEETDTFEARVAAVKTQAEQECRQTLPARLVEAVRALFSIPACREHVKKLANAIGKVDQLRAIVNEGYLTCSYTAAPTFLEASWWCMRIPAGFCRKIDLDKPQTWIELPITRDPEEFGLGEGEMLLDCQPDDKRENGRLARIGIVVNGNLEFIEPNEEMACRIIRAAKTEQVEGLRGRIFPDYIVSCLRVAKAIELFDETQLREALPDFANKKYPKSGGGDIAVGDMNSPAKKTADQQQAYEANLNTNGTNTNPTCAYLAKPSYPTLSWWCMLIPAGSCRSIQLDRPQTWSSFDIIQKPTDLKLSEGEMLIESQPDIRMETGRYVRIGIVVNGKLYFIWPIGREVEQIIRFASDEQRQKLIKGPALETMGAILRDATSFQREILLKGWRDVQACLRIGMATELFNPDQLRNALPFFANERFGSLPMKDSDLCQ